MSFKDIEPGSYGIEAIDPLTPGAIICGSCGRAWAEDITPAGRCPWEIDHAHSDGEDDSQGQPEPGNYGWIDFAHMETDEDPERFYIEIFSTDDDGRYEDEIAVICHRLVGGKYPLDGDVANAKRANAQRIVDALNAARA